MRLHTHGWIAAVTAASLVLAAGASSAACETALLVVDVQYVYVQSLELMTLDGIPLVEQLVRVLALARAAGVPIVYIQQVDPRYPVGDPMLDTVTEIAPLAGDPVIWKTRQDAFQDTTLASTLAEIGARRLLITGLATQGCVDNTALGAVRRGYETWVVGDAHAGIGSIDGIKYYNESWPSLHVSVANSEAIDFASLGCPKASQP